MSSVDTERLPYKVADISLADFGRKEIKLAENERPGLMAVALPVDYPWSVDDSRIYPAPGRILVDESTSGLTGTMIRRGQVLYFDLVWPLLDLAGYNLFLPFVTTHISEDITFTWAGGLQTTIQYGDPFFEHFRGAHYRGRMFLKHKWAQ